MKTLRPSAPFINVSWRNTRGFALVISLSLMVLLTVLAVGLLGLSSLALSTSTRETDLAEARANARMALALAIAQLQKQTGPDQRVTMTADQLSEGGNGEKSAAAAGKRHWTGVYRSWGNTATSRPTPQFLSWMTSGDSNDVENVDSAKAGSGKDAIELVGKGTLGEGKDDGKVEVPALRVNSLSGGAARLGWWTGDQGIKAAMATPPASEDKSIASLRSSLQGAPRNAVEMASAGAGGKPFAKLDLKDPKVALVTGWQQSSFLAADRNSPRGLFHDIAPFSTGLLTNLRTGGFRKDLSMQLERAATQANSQLATSRATNVLYKVGGENGINLHELWAYYNLYKDVKTSGSYKFTTGGTMSSGTPHVLVAGGPAACASDDYFYFKQPLITSYQLVLSLKTELVNGQNQLNVVADPIITFWNPLDVPVVIPISSFFSIKYFAIPYDIVVNVGGTSYTCPLIRAFSTSDSNFLSLIAGDSTQQLVFKPGEVIKVSQSGGLTQGSVNHKLVAKAGFNIGNGLRYPLKTDSGAIVNVPANSTVRYRAQPNAYTAGASGSSGMVPPGYSAHTRHFSTTHHEVYVGFDRETASDPSLGYGGMYVDFDFGNKRLKPSETRGETQGGTKPSNQRTNAKAHPTVFRQITEAMGRPLTSSQLSGSKSPIMIISYNAKTEGSTDAAARTRYLGRLNPRAHHVDFYDLSQKERDMMSYEYVVDPLVSWKNRALETSTTGNAYFGGGLNAELGNSFVTTHSVPKEPIVSLAALQHSCANGFEIFRPKDGYACLNAREPMMPQVSHAIGNSVAPPIFTPAQTESTLAGSRPAADHSYLANLNLWDDWFFSGISPQDRATFTTKKRAQRQVAQEFLDGTAKLPTVRYLQDTGSQEVSQLMTKLFSGANPTDAATQFVASLIRVDGMFNVNSTSVEAWKSILGGLKGREIVVRSPEGKESAASSKDEDVPVTGMLSPVDAIADGQDSQVKDPEQWVGRREITEEEIEQLAQAIVKEVRKRGPFLSLSDFVNRRPGSDKNLARAGAVQSALDSEDVDINSAWQESDRAVSNAVTSRFAFPEAEKGASGYGMPGIVKQADILTPIAPILAARSDSFIIRTYGESVDEDGKVLARAWCEATVERSKDFVDTVDKLETPIASLSSNANKTFGRRYEMTSFRWLHPDEV
jgi:Tfp pilus assembly protein PilX